MKWGQTLLDTVVARQKGQNLATVTVVGTEPKLFTDAASVFRGAGGGR